MTIATNLVNELKTMKLSHDKLLIILKNEGKFLDQSRGIIRWGYHGAEKHFYRDHYKLDDGSVVIDDGKDFHIDLIN